MNPRQYYYQPGQAARAPVVPGPVQVQAAPVDNTAGEALAHLDDFMKVAGQAIGREYVAQQTARVDDAVLKVQQEFDQFRAEYQQANQGADALSAAQDYGKAYEELSQRAIKEFNGAGHEKFGGMLEQRLRERGRQAVGAGLEWQARQTEVWKLSQLQGQEDEYFRRVEENPEDVATIVAEQQNLKDSARLKNPGKDLTAEYNRIEEQTVARMADGLLAKGDTAGVRQLLASPLARTGGKPGALGEAVARFESGQEGVLSVGWDQTGGTSYGKFQLSSKQGSLEGWLRYCEGLGGVAKEKAQALRAAGIGDTGSAKGKAVEVYKQLARENPELFERTQREYYIKTNYATTINSIKRQAPALAKAIEDDASLREMVFSTAVQHGGAGATRILTKVWREGMSREELIAATYNERGNHFQSSTPATRRAVRNRFRDEQQVIMNLGRERSVLHPRQVEAILNRCAAIERQKQAELSAGLAEQVKNYIAASQDGHIQDVPFSFEQVQSGYGERAEQVWAEVQGARELAMDVQSARSLSLMEMAGLLEARKPAPDSPHYVVEMQNYERLGRQLGMMQKQMAEDPAGYVAAADESVARARANFFGGMTRESCQEFLAKSQAAMSSRGIGGRLLSRADAEALGAQLSQSPNPTAMAKQLGQCFGSSYPQALREMAGSLAPAVLLAASGMRDEPGRLLIQASRDKKFEEKAQKLLADNGLDRKDFDERVGASLAELNATFMAGGNTEMPLAIRQGVSQLALAFMLRDSDLSEKKAIEKASKEIISERYDIHSFRGNGSGCRIPRQGVEVDKVKLGLDHFLNFPPLGHISAGRIPGTDETIMGEALKSHLRRNGYWVTDEDEGGAVLFLGGRAVAGQDGRPYRLSWQELERIGRERRKDMETQLQTGGRGQGW